MIDRHIPLGAAGFVEPGKDGNPFEQRRFACTVLPTMIVIARSKLFWLRIVEFRQAL